MVSYNIEWEHSAARELRKLPREAISHRHILMECGSWSVPNIPTVSALVTIESSTTWYHQLSLFRLFESAIVEISQQVTGVEHIIVPWSEAVRYSQRKQGYHGGATPQEVLVPLAVLQHRTIAGWEALPDREPALRLRGILAGVQRLLNVDGYQVLAVDDISGTVAFKRQLLNTQFQLECV